MPPPPHQPGYTTAVTRYEDDAARESAAQFHDAMGGVAGADNVVYTVQNTSTERCMQETEFGGVLTIITTTVTRTITERVLDSEDDDSDDDVYAGDGSYLEGLRAIDNAAAHRGVYRNGSAGSNGTWTHDAQRTFYRR